MEEANTSKGNRENAVGNGMFTKILSYQKIILSVILLGLTYTAFGILIGLIPQIYPEEAIRRGANSAEVLKGCFLKLN